MSVNFKALGGMFTFRYINDIEDLDLEDLQVIYNDLEEEHKNFKDELARLKDAINKKTPEEWKVKRKKKPKTAKEVLGDEEIPYEVRMKYIIDAYRKDQQKWGKLAGYAKHLEGEVIRLKEILIANGYTDSGVVGDSPSAKVIKEQKERICELENRLKDLKDAGNRIKELESRIATFPLRIYKSVYFRDIIKSQKEYINELQTLLDYHDIPYEPRLPINELEKEGVEIIVEKTIEYKDKNEITMSP